MTSKSELARQRVKVAQAKENMLEQERLAKKDEESFWRISQAKKEIDDALSRSNQLIDAASDIMQHKLELRLEPLNEGYLFFKDYYDQKHIKQLTITQELLLLLDDGLTDE